MTERFDDYLRSDDDIVARVAGPLKAREYLDTTFDARVMSAAHAEALKKADANYRSRTHPADVRRGWWIRPLTMEVSPFRGALLAAGFAGICFALGAAFNAQLVRRESPAVASAPAAATHSDTVHIVRFVLRAPDARSVSLVGDFNSWTKGATVLATPRGDGTWVVSLALPAGRHEYAFIVDENDGRGQRWVADPLVSSRMDEFGTESSLLELGSQSASAGSAD